MGQLLAGRYRVMRFLGRGGMGSVFLAEHVHLGRPTAVKLLRRELCTDPDAEARFRREALLAAKISHPNIAQIYDFDCTPEGQFLIAMEFVEGETIAQRLRRGGIFPLPLAAQVLAGIAEGLDRAHALGILHRDLKPENVMLAAGGEVKLLDFGVARSIDTSGAITSSGMIVGTPAYMSPEQLTGDELGPPTDIYSLGTVFYEMLTGQQTHTGTSFSEFRARRLLHPPTAVHLLRPECSTALTEAVARSLEVYPGARWASAMAFAQAVVQAIAGGASPSTATPVDGRTGSTLDRWEAHFEALRLAGRDREVRVVRDAWAAARAGRTTVLWIEGDEGAGKSAFFEVAERQAAADGCTVLAGRGYETDVVRPYGPSIPILREALSLIAGRDRPWPVITSLTDTVPDAHPPDRAALFEQVADLLRAAAGQGPLLIGMEDLDWCDPPTISLTEFIANDLTDVPALIAMTAQSGPPTSKAGTAAREFRERLRRREGVIWVSLRPLAFETVATWLTRALGHEASDELTRFVYGNTEGNAFFIEQVMRSLVERGDIERMKDESIRVSLTYDQPPEAVADVVERRLKGMSPAAREILQIAAVIGREFDVDLVLELSTRSEDAVLDAFDEAERAGALAVVPRAGDWYRFTHNKIGQVLAQSLNPRRRRKLHQQTAEVLSGRPGTAPGVLAWHWYHADAPARACEAALAAARSALSLHDYDDALTFGAMAAEVARTPEEKIDAHELRGNALRRLHRQGEAAAAYARARLVGGARPRELHLRRKELRCALQANTVSPVAAVTEARKLAEEARGMAPIDQVTTGILLSEALTACGEAQEAITVAQRVRATAAGCGDRSRMADALVALGHAHLRAHAVAEADAAAREAYAVFQEVGDPYGSARAGLLQGAAAAEAGQSGAARQALDLALQQAERAGVTRLVRQIAERRAELGSGGSS